MNLKKSVFSLALAATLCAPSFASTVDYGTDKSTNTITTDIRNMIPRMDIDFTTMDAKTIKIKFMVNDKNEIIIISTDKTDLDSAIKSALNYREVSDKGLKPYSVYIVPVTFEKV